MDFGRFSTPKKAKSPIRKHYEKAVGITLTAFFDSDRYENGFYVKKDDKEYEVLLRPEDLPKYHNLFSTPENDAHKKWCIKRTNGIEGVSDLDITFKYWKPIKPTLKIKGVIKDDKFILNVRVINERVDSEYKRYVAQDARKKD